jgi:DNA-binding CsgD family transcriptional regulator
MILDAFVPTDASLMYLNYLNFSKSWTASQVFVTPKADKPVDWMQNRRLVDVQPHYILDRPNLPLYRLSDIVTDPQELRNTELFQRYMDPEGWHHSACLLFWQGARLHSEITLRRSYHQGDFTLTEMALLYRLRQHFGTALNRLLGGKRNITDPVVFKLEGSNLQRSLESAFRKSAAVNGRGWSLAATSRIPLNETVRERQDEGLSSTRIIAFSEKERAVLRLAVSGVSNEQISRCLGVTIHTVKWHLANVYLKLGVKNRTAAVRTALSMHIV